ncbi:hypothetical protein [uncultured Parabacteroides sp.]|uniref:hypothetical protein n=1 Tax=uncultured Parabacteroides sp. TaxID=512312 RepID=UPI0026031AF2|nr:hypothetical protein [uncultured Parabacteroides sp.]
MSRRDYTKWKEIKNVLIRDLTDEDNDTIRAIMNDTGCFLASKALMRCVYSFLRMSATTKSLTALIQDLQQENHCLKQRCITCRGSEKTTWCYQKHKVKNQNRKKSNN